MKPTATPQPLPVDLATESKLPVLEFLMFKTMAYGKRRWLFALLLLLGAAIQFATLWVLPGYFFILFAVLLMWVVGLDNQLDYHGMRVKETWIKGEYAYFSRIVELDRKQARWYISLFNFSGCWGQFLFVIACGGLALLTYLATKFAGQGSVGRIVLFDGLTLICGQWFRGRRQVERRPSLVQKADHFIQTVGPCARAKQLKEHLGSLLFVNPEAAPPVPKDLKLNLAFPDSPDYFYGLQGQVVLNAVRGVDYPYFYAVVVCKQGHGLDELTREVAIPDKVVREVTVKDGAEVVIIRQHTTDTSGYHTSAAQSAKILDTAIRTAETFLARQAPAGKRG